MECVPACVTCTGLCKRARPVSAPSKPARRRRTPSGEGSGDYISLKCGHTTNTDAQLFFALFYRTYSAHNRVNTLKTAWCDKCDKWVQKISHLEAAKREIAEIRDREKRLF